MSEKERIAKALEIAAQSGGVDGGHHKMWVIDQMVRALTGCPMERRAATDYRGQPYEYETQGESDEYRDWVSDYEVGDGDGSEYASWDTGIAP